MITFSDLPGLLVDGAVIFLVFAVVFRAWDKTGGRFAEWWTMRRARPLEDYDE